MADPFQASMAKLAAAIALKASEKDTSLTESIDALKALTPYLALRLKENGRKGVETGEETSFADFAAEINGTSTGDTSNGKAVRGGSRRARATAS